jgi:hypothetical protein
MVYWNFDQQMSLSKSKCWHHRYRKAKIDCISLFMCPLLAQLKIGFFSSFSAAAVYSTNETNKAGLKQSIILRCLWLAFIHLFTFFKARCSIWQILKHEIENYRVVFIVELGAVAEGQADGVLGVVGEPGALRHR